MECTRRCGPRGLAAGRNRPPTPSGPRGAEQSGYWAPVKRGTTPGRPRCIPPCLVFVFCEGNTFAIGWCTPRAPAQDSAEANILSGERVFPRNTPNQEPTVFILSVHFQASRWVGIQRRYLDLHVDMPQRRMFAINGVSEDLFLDSELTISHTGNHAQGLNMLAEHALQSAHNWDWLVFLDSDAFPIAPLSHTLRDTHQLIAVQRLENLGDIQPHPSFCAVKAGVWRKLQPDWSSGYQWTNNAGMSVTDVGGGVLKALDHSGTPWQPLIRRNRVNYHPLWFGVYGFPSGPGLVYHHGAGSRARSARVVWLGKKPLNRIHSVWRTLVYFSKVATWARRGGINVSIWKLARRRALFTEAFERAVVENPNFWKAVY